MLSAVLALSACGGGGGEGSDNSDPADVPLSQAPELVQRFAGAFNAARAAPRACGDQVMPAVAPLTKWNPKLQAAAQRHADDMSRHNFFSHIGSDGSETDGRAKEAGYKPVVEGENLMRSTGNNSNAAKLTDVWLSSAGHCRTLMAAEARTVAVAQNGQFTVMLYGP